MELHSNTPLMATPVAEVLGRRAARKARLWGALLPPFWRAGLVHPRCVARIVQAQAPLEVRLEALAVYHERLFGSRETGGARGGPPLLALSHACARLAQLALPPQEEQVWARAVLAPATSAPGASDEQSIDRAVQFAVGCPIVMVWMEDGAMARAPDWVGHILQVAWDAGADDTTRRNYTTCGGWAVAQGLCVQYGMAAERFEALARKGWTTLQSLVEGPSPSEQARAVELLFSSSVRSVVVADAPLDRREQAAAVVLECATPLLHGAHEMIRALLVGSAFASAFVEIAAAPAASLADRGSWAGRVVERFVAEVRRLPEDGQGWAHAFFGVAIGEKFPEEVQRAEEYPQWAPILLSGASPAETGASRQARLALAFSQVVAGAVASEGPQARRIALVEALVAGAGAHIDDPLSRQGGTWVALLYATTVERLTRIDESAAGQGLGLVHRAIFGWLAQRDPERASVAWPLAYRVCLVELAGSEEALEGRRAWAQSMHDLLFATYAAADPTGSIGLRADAYSQAMAGLAAADLSVEDKEGWFEHTHRMAYRTLEADDPAGERTSPGLLYGGAFRRIIEEEIDDDEQERWTGVLHRLTHAEFDDPDPETTFRRWTLTFAWAYTHVARSPLPAEARARWLRRMFERVRTSLRTLVTAGATPEEAAIEKAMWSVDNLPVPEEERPIWKNLLRDFRDTPAP
jgi:hypothetical protein